MRSLRYTQAWGTVLAFITGGTTALFSHEIRDVDLDLSLHDTKPFYLRIAPLGASIVNGYLSTDKNGFRKDLRDRLRYEGWPVNMVGSNKAGTMKDNDNEGHPGWTIQQVIDAALPNIVPDQPNLILINVGTNNAIQNNNVNSAADLYITLLDNIWQEIPQATVILSTLLRNKDAATDARALIINEEIRTTVMGHYADLCKRLVLADMADGFITQADLNDSTHPTDAGYKKMASVWWDAFEKVEVAGFLQAPPAVGVSSKAINSTSGYNCDNLCDNDGGNYQIQLGSGTDDGAYVHSSEDMGVIWSSPSAVAKNESNPEHIFFANLVNKDGEDRGSEQDDVIYAYRTSGGWSWMFFLNDNLDFSFSAPLDLGLECAPQAARFADINSDGLDDFICITSSGNLKASLNKGGASPEFQYVGLIGVGPYYWTSDNYTPDRVHMADIDGDGRVDWCIQLYSGDITCCRNGGQGALPTRQYNGYWQDFLSGDSGWTTVFSSRANNNTGSVTLADINGDFKTDWLFVEETGQVETYINNRGLGDGLVPDWTDVGVTYDAPGDFNVMNVNSVVKFARIYGSGRRDYAWVQEVDQNDTAILEVRVWKNLGKGGTRLKGDGTHYCDMNGDGLDDYIWVGPNGETSIYLNIDNHPYWDNHLGLITLGVPRKTIHIADLDGDGKCDLLSVDKATGAIHMWQNQYDSSTNKFSFAERGLVTGNTTLCTQGYGVIENDLGVRFADLTGDGAADYLCIEPDGRVTGYINKGMPSSQVNLESVGQIKTATQYDRQDMRFNDVNGKSRYTGILDILIANQIGDGRADLLLLDKYNGHAAVWYNGGQKSTSRSAFRWRYKGVLYNGWDRGANMNFGALSGQGRADIIQVIPRTNMAYISYKYPEDSDGDDPDMGNPDLPEYTSNETNPDSDACRYS